MPIQVTSQILDSDPTGVLNEFRVKLKHEADFPTGPADPVTAVVPTVHHGIEQSVTIVAIDGPAFRQAVRALGNAWKAQIVAMLVGRGPRIIGGLSVGDVIGPY